MILTQRIKNISIQEFVANNQVIEIKGKKKEDMYKHKLYFWIVLGSSLLTIYSLVTAILLYKQGERDYFIVYMVVTFGISKLYQIIRLCKSGNEDETCYRFFDLFELGFLCVFFDDNFSKEYDRSEMYLFFFTINSFIQFLFFICIGVLESRNIQQDLILASYLNYIFTFIFISIFFTVMDEYIKQRVVDKRAVNVFFPIQYFFLISSQTFFAEKSGINLAYFYLIILGINLIILTIIYYFQKEILSYCEIIVNLIYIIGFRVDFGKQIFYDERLEIILVQIVKYFQEIVEISLLIRFSYDQIGQYFDKQLEYTVRTNIKIVFTLGAILFLALDILIKSTNIFTFYKKECIFKVRCYEDLIEITHQLTQRVTQQKSYKIFLLSNNKIEHNKNRIITTDEIQLVFQFWKAVSFQQTLNQIPFIERSPDTFMVLNEPFILAEVEHIHPKLYNMLNKRKLNEDVIDLILIRRLLSGYFFKNESTNALINNIKRKNKIQYIHEIMSDILQISTYYKLLSPLTLNSSPQIINDLYQF